MKTHSGSDVDHSSSVVDATAFLGGFLPTDEGGSVMVLYVLGRLDADATTDCGGFAAHALGQIASAHPESLIRLWVETLSDRRRYARTVYDALGFRPTGEARGGGVRRTALWAAHATTVIDRAKGYVRPGLLGRPTSGHLRLT